MPTPLIWFSGGCSGTFVSSTFSMVISANFKKYFIELASLLFIFLFVYAATSKLADFQKFRIQLGQSPILTHFANQVAWIIPSLEIILSTLLAFPAYRLVGFYGSFCLMIMFTTYIIAILRYSEYIPCSCGGILQHMNWNQHLIFNLLFIALALAGILLYQMPERKNILLQ